jgi:hypothetical protein
VSRGLYQGCIAVQPIASSRLFRAYEE